MDKEKCPFCIEKDKEIESLKSTLNNIIEMAKTYGVVYCREDNERELNFENNEGKQ